MAETAADNPHHDRRWLILGTVCVAQLIIVLAWVDVPS
jgi:hypothetical protein